ncbi:MAG: 2-oxoglutarate ferredoxin oxidoreductase subunit gamma [Candidatus Cloacimonadota bacterium]|nr:MAG: 2-oxoglutarate ferredoxin oxidoreductase subunit gamma [Candidatus Cloacimonadota bacterium]
MAEYKKTEIRLSGSGGQGLITAGIILARAAVIDKARVTQTQSYGPESRGGASRADVIIANDDIFYPEATRFDILLALTQEACDKYLFDLKPKGTLVADSSFVKNISLISSNIYEVPFTEIALKELGSELPTNIMTLGFLVKMTNVVSVEALEESVKQWAKPAFLDLNMKALKIGYDLYEKHKLKQV